MLPAGCVGARYSFHSLSRKLSTLQRLATEELYFPCSLEAKVLDMNSAPLQRALFRNVETRRDTEATFLPAGLFCCLSTQWWDIRGLVTALQGPLFSSVTVFFFFSRPS